MERELACHQNGAIEVHKLSTSSLTVHSRPNSRHLGTPSQTQNYGFDTNILPSKFHKLAGRPLPPHPLESSGLQVQKNDSRTSFKPAKKSDHRSQPSLPLKVHHVANVPTNNSIVQTTPRVITVQTMAQPETEYVETKHTATADDFDLAENRSRSNKLPSPLQRSRSISRPSGSYSVSWNNNPGKLPHSVSESSDTRTGRSATPRSLAVDKSADSPRNRQVNNEYVSTNNKSEISVTQISRRRSSSVSSSARVRLQSSNPSWTSPLTLGIDGKQANVDDSALVDGKLKSNTAKENSLKITVIGESSKSQDVTKQLSSNHRYTQPVRSISLDQGVVKVKPSEKSSSNHGILGGKSDDEVKSATDSEQKSLPCASQSCCMV